MAKNHTCKTLPELIDQFEWMLFHANDVSEDFVLTMKGLISSALQGNRIAISPCSYTLHEQFQNDDWGYNGATPRILFPDHTDGGIRMDVLVKFYHLCKESGVDLYIEGQYGPKKLFS